jgi:predicted amidohydrolase
MAPSIVIRAERERSMRIGHCQLVSKPGNFEGNLAKVVQGLEMAHKDRVEVLSFPECYLTGYQDTEEEVRKHAFAADSAKMMQVLDRTSQFETTLIVGFNEVRGKDLYNTCLVAYKGHLLGLYSKCAAYMKFHKQGRDFPVFERNGVKFGVIICADGGYVEPARILALKGAKIIFAPHYNYIGKEGLIRHFMQVRADHVARARENGVYFVRGNNVVPGKDEAIKGYRRPWQSPPLLSAT